MKTPFQQFQQRVQQHQQQRMRDMQGYAWTQEMKRQRDKQMALQNMERINQRFSHIEQTANRLRKQAQTGQISQHDLEAKMLDLMIQDSHGTRWKVGAKSGQWYRYDGKNWAPAQRPFMGAERPTIGTGGSQIFANQRSQALVCQGSKKKAFFKFIIGIFLCFALFLFIAKICGFFIAGAVGFIGIIVTIKKTRSAARGY